MGTPHKHAEVIKAWADGNTVQVLVDNEWGDVVSPSWSYDNQYRIKPEMAKYRVAAMRSAAGKTYTSSVDHEHMVKSVENSAAFVRWLSNWIEFEVEE